MPSLRCFHEIYGYKDTQQEDPESALRLEPSKARKGQDMQENTNTNTKNITPPLVVELRDELGL